MSVIRKAIFLLRRTERIFLKLFTILWIKCRILSGTFCTLRALYCIFVALLVFSMISLICCYIQLKSTIRKPTSYIVDTPGCRIPGLDPWDPLIRQYLSKPEKPICAQGKPTLVKTKLNRLYIAPEAVSSYVKQSKYPLDCCHRTFWRHTPDFPGKEGIRIYSHKCKPFVDTIIHDDYVIVQCFVNHKEIYQDYFAFVQVKPEVEARCDSAASTHKTPNISVLIMGIDGMSRNHLYRSMPRTVALLHNMSSVDMAGVNVVGRHTILNLVPMLTGLSYDELIKNCWPNATVEFDLCPWIFRDFSRVGFRTAYGENMIHWSMFTNNRAGFRVQPADYYLNPAMALTDQHIKKFCFGTRIESQILIDFADNFVTKMKSKRFFSFFWDGRLTYHDFNVHSTYDKMYVSFLHRHLRSGLFNRTIFVFLSDHGYRWGKLRETFQGLYEQRNPFVFFLFPDWFKKRYSEAMTNIYNNSKHLVTFYDVHETLIDIIRFRDTINNDICVNRTKKMKLENSVPRGISLFLSVPVTRTCTTAGINENLCLCQNMVALSVYDETVKAIASVLVNDLSVLVSHYSKCSMMKLEYIHSAWVSRQNKSMLQSMDKGMKSSLEGEVNDLVEYTVMIMTLPAHALFEATYRYWPGSWGILSSFYLVGEIQRINRYENQSHCITDVMLKPYCYCKDLLN